MQNSKTGSPSNPAAPVWPIGKKAAFYSCSIVCLLGMFDTLDRQIVSAIFPFLKAEWNLTDTELGSLASIVSMALAILVVPSAYLIDRWSRTKMISLMGIIWTLGLVGCAFASGFWHMLTARFFVGAGQAGYNPAAHALLAVQFPERYRSTAIAIYHFFLAAGAPLGLITGAFIATHWGWRHALGIVAVPSLILALLALFIRDYKTVSVTEPAEKTGAAETTATTETPKPVSITHKVTFGEQLLRVLRTPSLLCVFLANISMHVYFGARVSWMPSYFMREGGYSLTDASTLASITMIATTCSTLLVGPVIDWARRYKSNGTPLVMLCALTISTIGMVSAFGFMPAGSVMQVTTLTIAGLFGGSFMTGGPMVIIELTHPGARATTFSVLILAQAIFGLSLGPLLAGYLSDKYDLATSMTILASVTFIACLAYLMCIFTYKRDAAKVQTVSMEFEKA